MIKHVLPLAVMLIFEFSDTWAATYTCNEVQDKAVLAYDGEDKVSIVGQSDVCSFSIGGASVDGMEVYHDWRQEQEISQLLARDVSRFAEIHLLGIIERHARAHGNVANFILNDFDNLEYNLERAYMAECGNGDRKLIVGDGDFEIGCQLLDSQPDHVVEFYELNTAVIANRSIYVIDIVNRFDSSKFMQLFIPRI